MAKTNVSKWNYGRYSSGNYGANSIAVEVGRLTLWFSYNTVVAFREAGHLSVISENVWGTTTGKHLNWIDPDHSKRISRDKFETELNKVLKRHKLTVDSIPK